MADDDPARDNTGAMIVTTSGRVITEGEMKRWVEEAERGYDVAELLKGRFVPLTQAQFLEEKREDMAMSGELTRMTRLGAADLLVLSLRKAWSAHTPDEVDSLIGSAQTTSALAHLPLVILEEGQTLDAVDNDLLLKLGWIRRETVEKAISDGVNLISDVIDTATAARLDGAIVSALWREDDAAP